MESLAAMCEAFVPSLSSQELKSSNGKEDLPTKGLQDFYLASGSQSPVPGEASSIPSSPSDLLSFESKFCFSNISSFLC
ncbi:hypothetical protein KSP40_PGU018924 [Platanthera guangdongensis]|uniref:Uncharacterized protein n=1 Tax=Platanthera guangdongensis TaxID=2320717 RepID=A0ABR2LGE8_9ASPA